MKIKDNNIKLLVCLGNPGKKYTNTRHNAGFMFSNFMTKKLSEKTLLETSKKDFDLVEIKELDIKILKPSNFMNNSGEALRDYLKYHQIQEDQILIVHDDLDLKLGEYKIQVGKSPKSHNGVLSLERQNDIDNTLRLRIGVENRIDSVIPGGSYVLMDFSDAEKQLLEETFDNIWKQIQVNE